MDRYECRERTKETEGNSDDSKTRTHLFQNKETIRNAHAGKAHKGEHFDAAVDPPDGARVRQNRCTTLRFWRNVTSETIC